MELKLVELTDQPWELRWKALTEFLKAELDINLATEIKTCDLAHLKEKLDEVVASDADICRISDDMSTEVSSLIARTTQKAQFAGACPFLVREKGQWWPRPLLDEAFSRCMLDQFGQIDDDAVALVAGAGGSARLIVASIAMSGYSTIVVTDKDEALAKNLVAEMKKKFFKVDFQAISFQSITTLPGIHSLVVNTTKLSLENDLLDELYFFNFLKAGGAVIDLTLVPAETPLIMEAKQWGARHLSGDYLEADRDLLMIEKLTGKRLSTSKYREALRRYVDAAPFDASPFLERFKDRGS